MTAIEKVIELSLSQVGYTEKDSPAHLDASGYEGTQNYTKYARDLDAVPGFYNGKKQGYAWCDVFVDWLFVKCFGAETGRQMLYQPKNSAGAGCTYSYQYYKAAGALYHEPQPGDQIFFGTIALSTHTGLVTDVDELNVYTVEGNAGDAVRERVYPKNSSNIVGYGRPDWALAEGDEKQEAGTTESTTEHDGMNYYPAGGTATETPSGANYGKNQNTFPPELSLNCKGMAVEVLQWLLERHGYSVGHYGIDGEFGPDTKKALSQFQMEKRLWVDGICGEQSWSALFMK